MKTISETTADGGPAFPFPAEFNTECGILIPDNGMSLRTYIATAVLQGMLAGGYYEYPGDERPVRDSVVIADNLIRELNAKK